ncbi:hypothetical protein ARMGADRAFT_491001 [Armillaria gallica]|uniref:Uncharacterized protein n=1 Tax=Armillaria gallica TaxID=47427 RepID=A0A2H3DV81_ARMGA|nr:hypothetical protein ARMGADRAFT_491001 [Armillaria gallica]
MTLAYLGAEPPFRISVPVFVDHRCLSNSASQLRFGSILFAPTIKTSEDPAFIPVGIRWLLGTLNNRPFIAALLWESKDSDRISSIGLVRNQSGLALFGPSYGNFPSSSCDCWLPQYCMVSQNLFGKRRSRCTVCTSSRASLHIITSQQPHVFHALYIMEQIY